MSGFLGAFDHQLDDKGRIALPAAFRKGAEGEPLVLMQLWDDPHLTLLPPPVWVELLQGLKELRRVGETEANQVRTVLAAATEVVPDKQGRILVPASLQESASLSGTVIVHGNIDRIELWNPARFRSAVGASPGEDRAALHRFKSRLML